MSWRIEIGRPKALRNKKRRNKYKLNKGKTNALAHIGITSRDEIADLTKNHNTKEGSLRFVSHDNYISKTKCSAILRIIRLEKYLYKDNGKNKCIKGSTVLDIRIDIAQLNILITRILISFYNL